MDVQEAIATRRSIGKVSDEPIGREQVTALLEAAVRAPTHHLTEPWRFVVLTGAALDELGAAMAERVSQASAGAEDLEDKVALEKSRPRRAPVIITVVYRPSQNPKAIEVEDRYSVGAAMQNILLLAHAQGMGAYLRTGPASRYKGVAEHLGLSDEEEIAGFIYVGKPLPQDEPAPMSRRTPASDVTEWRGWD